MARARCAGLFASPAAPALCRQGLQESGKNLQVQGMMAHIPLEWRISEKSD
jgi:hypothetical protein